MSVDVYEGTERMQVSFNMFQALRIIWELAQYEDCGDYYHGSCGCEPNVQAARALLAPMLFPSIE
jgi:hypothetical protein